MRYSSRGHAASLEGRDGVRAGRVAHAVQAQVQRVEPHARVVGRQRAAQPRCDEGAQVAPRRVGARPRVFALRLAVAVGDVIQPHVAHVRDAVDRVAAGSLRRALEPRGHAAREAGHVAPITEHGERAQPPGLRRVAGRRGGQGAGEGEDVAALYARVVPQQLHQQRRVGRAGQGEHRVQRGRSIPSVKLDEKL